MVVFTIDPHIPRLALEHVVNLDRAQLADVAATAFLYGEELPVMVLRENEVDEQDGGHLRHS